MYQDETVDEVLRLRGENWRLCAEKGRAIELLEAEIARLEMRVEDLLAVNTRYLLRARAAEDEATALRSEMQSLRTPSFALD